jgi:hypothetical protein
VSDAELAAFETSLGLAAIRRSQAGLVDDMDYVADVLYGRVQKQVTEQTGEVALQR